MNYSYHPQLYSCPEIWALSGDEFKLYAALLTFCKPDGTGAYPFNKTLLEMTGKSETTLSRNLKTLEDAGVITRIYANERNGRKGCFRSVRVNYVPTIAKGFCVLEDHESYEKQIAQQDYQIQNGTVVVSNYEYRGVPASDMVTSPPVKTFPSPPAGTQKNTPIREHSPKEQQQEDGLSLSDGASNLPNPNTYKPENLAPRKGAVLTEAQRNLATQLLGASGQDRQFAASVSQEMANTTGFLEFYLKATIKASKERKIKGTTIAYLIGSINNSWCNGDWVDPDQAAREQKEKEIAARRARLDRLT